MARTKQTARKWTGGKEPRWRLNLPTRKDKPQPPAAQVKAPTKQLKAPKKEPKRLTPDDKARMRVFALWKPRGKHVALFIEMLKKDVALASGSPEAFKRLVMRCCSTMRVMGPEVVAKIETARDMHAAIGAFREKKGEERRADAASRLPSCEVTETREETATAAAQWEGGKSKAKNQA